jgi:hypothetical protein
MCSTSEEFYLLGYNAVESIISQKIELLIATVVRTSNSPLLLSDKKIRIPHHILVTLSRIALKEST